MTLPNQTNSLLQASSPSGYTINNSLRFRSSASANLSRTPSVAGNRKTWTYSAWVKRGQLGAYQGVLAALGGTGISFGFFNSDQFYMTVAGISNPVTTAVFRDPSSWYHVVIKFDTTQATAANRVLIYINNVNYPLSSIIVSQNTDYEINNTTLQDIGATDVGGSRTYFDGYMAEVNFIDGQALTPASFGAYNGYGMWQPVQYGGTYGTNGFYLPFSDTSALTTSSNVGLGKDFSGNANYWTTNNISLTAGVTYDAMRDAPTVGPVASNYAVLNPLKNGGGAITNANLQFTANTVANQAAFGTMAISSGKFYFEAYLNQGSPTGNAMIGVYDAAGAVNTSWYTAAAGWALDSNADGNFYKRHNGTAASFGARTNPATAMVAVDKDANKIWFGFNGTWFASGDPAAGTNAAYTDLSSAAAVTVAAEVYANQGSNDYVILNCGQRPFTYTPPTGFVALNAYNLPAPAINNGASYMAATTYTGNSSTQTISNGANTTTNVTFQPDLVWAKNRTSGSNSHNLSDSIRGATNGLASNLTAAEYSIPAFAAFTANGFSLSTGTGVGQVNTTGDNYIAWQWKAGGAGVSNTAGSITSTVSVNAAAGFSVVAYHGTGVNATVGHGLGVAPSMVIIKDPDYSLGSNWIVWHSAFVTASNTDYLFLQSTGAKGGSGGLPLWNNTAPTSSVFSLGTDTNVNYSVDNFIAYCWSAVPGYSAFGSYTGNGSTDGPFVYLGFRPRYILWKRTDATADWGVIDTSRDPYNTTGYDLTPNAAAAEGSGYTVDFLSNGFKIRLTATRINASGGTYIYAAFAENPFKYALAR